MKLLATSLIALFLAGSANASPCPGDRWDAPTFLSRIEKSGASIFEVSAKKMPKVLEALSERFNGPFKTGTFYVVNFNTSEFGILLVTDGCSDLRLPLAVPVLDLAEIADKADLHPEDMKPYHDGISM